MSIQVEIVTPERLLLSQEADMVLLPGEAGQMGVMRNHVPLMTTLIPGEIILFRNGEEDEILAVSGGLAEVRPDTVTILADTAERGDEIDVARAQAARDQAEQSLAERQADGTLSPVHVAALRRSHVRLRVAQRRRQRTRPGDQPTN